jgi:hypothetical protein
LPDSDKIVLVPINDKKQKGETMIRIAIVEDEDSYVQVLTGYLKQYETEHSLSFQISVIFTMYMR